MMLSQHHYIIPGKLG